MPLIEQFPHRRSSSERRLARIKRKKRLRMPKKIKGAALQKLKRARKKTAKKLKARGFFKKLAKLRSSFELPATVQEGVLRHPQEYIAFLLDEIAEQRKEGTPEDDVRAFVDVFLKKSPMYTSNGLGMAALQFETFLMERGEGAFSRFVETVVYPDESYFHAVFDGRLDQDTVKRLREGVKEFCEFEVQVEAGQASQELGQVSGATVLACTSVGEARTPNADDKPELKKTLARHYQQVEDDGGLTALAFNRIYEGTEVSQTIEPIQDERWLFRMVDENGVAWYYDGDIWMPDNASYTRIEEAELDEGKTEKELKAGLGRWVMDYRAVRKTGNVKIAKQIKADIEAVIKKKKLDRDAVFAYNEANTESIAETIGHVAGYMTPGQALEWIKKRGVVKARYMSGAYPTKTTDIAWMKAKGPVLKQLKNLPKEKISFLSDPDRLMVFTGPLGKPGYILHLGESIDEAKKTYNESIDEARGPGKQYAARRVKFRNAVLKELGMSLHAAEKADPNHRTSVDYYFTVKMSPQEAAAKLKAKMGKNEDTPDPFELDEAGNPGIIGLFTRAGMKVNAGVSGVNAMWVKAQGDEPFSDKVLSKVFGRDWKKYLGRAGQLGTFKMKGREHPGQNPTKITLRKDAWAKLMSEAGEMDEAAENVFWVYAASTAKGVVHQRTSDDIPSKMQPALSKAVGGIGTLSRAKSRKDADQYLKREYPEKGRKRRDFTFANGKLRAVNEEIDEGRVNVELARHEPDIFRDAGELVVGTRNRMGRAHRNEFRFEEGTPNPFDEGLSHAAKTLHRQIGGKALFMLGAKNVVGLKDGLQMKIGKNGLNANFLKITLNAKDLYDIEFARSSFGAKAGHKYTVKKKFNDIPVENLHKTIQDATGLALSLTKHYEGVEEGKAADEIVREMVKQWEVKDEFGARLYGKYAGHQHQVPYDDYVARAKKMIRSRTQQGVVAVESAFGSWRIEGDKDGCRVDVKGRRYEIENGIEEVGDLLANIVATYNDLPEEGDMMTEAFLKEFCDENGNGVELHEGERGNKAVRYELIHGRDRRISERAKLRLTALRVEDADEEELVELGKAGMRSRHMMRPVKRHKNRRFPIKPGLADSEEVPMSEGMQPGYRKATFDEFAKASAKKGNKMDASNLITGMRIENYRIGDKIIAQAVLERGKKPAYYVHKDWDK